jgi:hypothetical protein
MHRAYSMVRLVAALDDRLPVGMSYRLGAAAEYGLAIGLAALFRSLDVSTIEAVVPCAAAVRTTVRNLIQLFGPILGQTHVSDWIEPIELPAQQCRALVLATSELVVNALLHGFAGRRSGCIAVTLCRTEPSEARLSVADDGCGRPQDRAYRRDGIISDLSAILATEVIYPPTGGGGTLAEVSFPIRHRAGDVGAFRPIMSAARGLPPDISSSAMATDRHRFLSEASVPR